MTNMTIWPSPGGITGPGSTTIGDIVVWDSIDGSTVGDSGVAIATNGNLFANNFISGYQTTATAAGTTTLTVASKGQQFFTGSTNQTLVLPVTSTLTTGLSYRVVNTSTGLITIQSSGANTIIVLGSLTECIVTCILTSGTTAASWSVSDPSITVINVPLLTDDTYRGTVVVGFNNSGVITQWDAVYLNSSSAWVKADADSAGKFPARGIALRGTAGTVNLPVLTYGVVRNDGFSFTPGATLYLSETAGEITETAPVTSGSVVQQLGYALDADTIFVDFCSTYITLA